MASPGQGKTSDDQLAQWLAAVANPTRLALLRALRKPSRLGNIDVRVEDAGRERRLARQTISFHLDALTEVGVVQSQPVEVGDSTRSEFAINHQRLFWLGEELKDLARIRSDTEPQEATLPHPLHETGSRAGPMLVLVKGLDEGTVFSLAPAEEKTAWTLGRSRSCDVTLDFDPSISQQNALVAWDGQAHVLEDLPSSRNGTWLNFRPIPRGEKARLAHGDIIGLGRSLLVYWK